MTKKYPALLPELNDYARKGYNVFLIGEMGVGKTTEVLRVCQEEKLNLLYFSGGTMDPYVDFVGIPKPVGEGETLRLEFAKKLDLKEAEIIFIDELNRSDKHVQNGLLEIIQFKKINGTPLPKLKLVWGAINPDNGDYKVDKLDPALQDRFHIYCTIDAQPSVEFLASKMQEHTAEALCEWWANLTAAEKKIISPRRLEYIGRVFDDFNSLNSLPPGKMVQEKRLRELLKSHRDVKLNKPEDLFKHNAEAVKLAADPMNAPKLVDLVAKVANRLTEEPILKILSVMNRETLVQLWEKIDPSDVRQKRSEKNAQKKKDEAKDLGPIDIFHDAIIKNEKYKQLAPSYDEWDDMYSYEASEAEAEEEETK